MSIEETAQILVGYLRSESATDVLATDQEPQDGPAIRESLLDVAELLESHVGILPAAPGWMTNDADDLTHPELITTLTRARWAAWTATAALLATAAAGTRIAAEEPEVPEKLATATIPDSVDSD